MSGRHASRPRVPQLALVVFVAHAECRWLRGLRPGFRHCFVALRDGATWLCCDPLKDRIELSVLPVPPWFDLAVFYGKGGHTVLLGTTRPNVPRRPFAIAPLTCVTIAKRLLGVHAPWVLTPWQLCRLLQGRTHGFLPVGPASMPCEVSPAQPVNSALDSRRL